MPSLLGRPSLARAAVVTAGTTVAVVALLSAKASTSPVPGQVAMGSRLPGVPPAPQASAPGGRSDGQAAGPAPQSTTHSKAKPSSKAAAGAGSGSARRTAVGPVVQTDYGPVQVKVVAQGHQIVDVVPLQTPNGDRHSEEVAAYAIPILHQEALAAQSAQIDAVSGATFTSMGYAQSLQAALDALAK